MKKLFILMPLLIAACASASTAPVRDGLRDGARAPVNRTAAAPVIALPADPIAALSRFGQADSLTTRQAAALLGPPDVDRRDGVGALLTWRLPSCALVLGFANDRLVSADPAPPRAGDARPTAAQCLSEARARRPQS